MGRRTACECELCSHDFHYYEVDLANLRAIYYFPFSNMYSFPAPYSGDWNVVTLMECGFMASSAPHSWRLRSCESYYLIDRWVYLTNTGRPLKPKPH